ncbi:MAG: hypothetical protein LBP86_11050 [Azoarcus sp.]|nr:hypothetical protein [Azoarcus sp.]
MRLPFLGHSAGKPGWLAMMRSGEQCLFAHVERGRGAKALPCVTAIFELPFAEFAAGGGLGRWKGTRATALLDEYQVLRLEAPKVPRPEWKAALRWSLQEHLDFPVAQASFDVIDIPSEGQAAGRPHMVYVVVARSEAVLSLMQSFDGTGVALAAIDVPGLALRNVSALLENPGQGQACLYFDHQGGQLVVTFGGELYDFRRINISLAQLGRAGEDEKRQIFERINLDLQRTFDTLDRQCGFISMNRLSIAHQPELAGLPGYLRDNLYVPVDLLSLEDRLDMRSCPQLRHPLKQSHFLLAIGAALREAMAGDASGEVAPARLAAQGGAP